MRRCMRRCTHGSCGDANDQQFIWGWGGHALKGAPRSGTLKNFRISDFGLWRISEFGGEMFFKVPSICHPSGSLVYKGASRGGTLKNFRISDFGLWKISEMFGAKFFQSPQNLPPLGLPCLQGSYKGRDFEKFRISDFGLWKNFGNFRISGRNFFKVPRKNNFPRQRSTVNG